MKHESPSAIDPAAPPDSLTKHAPPPPKTAPRSEAPAPRRSSRLWIWLLILVLVIGAIYFWSTRSRNAGGAAGAAAQAQKKGFGAIPVVVAKARKGNIPVYFVGLGGVTPIYTVTVKSRVDGQLMSVHYKEGDVVAEGAPLIEIDPRPYDAALTQAQGQLIRDQALLDNARIDLARYKTLLSAERHSRAAIGHATGAWLRKTKASSKRIRG